MGNTHLRLLLSYLHVQNLQPLPLQQLYPLLLSVIIHFSFGETIAQIVAASADTEALQAPATHQTMEMQLLTAVKFIGVS